MRFLHPAWMCAALALSGCAASHRSADNMSTLGQAADQAAIAGAAGLAAESASQRDPNVFLPNDPGPHYVLDGDGKLVGFKLGVSSQTVEKMAKQQGCEPAQGAGLVSAKGPIEQYRVDCGSGGGMIAQCELRQCALTRAE